MASNYLKSVYAYVAVLLAVVYFAGALQLSRVHSLLHSHDAVVTHSHEQEEDPCHRFIYHNDNTGGCHHDSHIVANEKCATCDLAFQTGVATLPVSASLEPAIHSNEFLSVITSFVNLALSLSSSRAPPMVS